MATGARSISTNVMATTESSLSGQEGTLATNKRATEKDVPGKAYIFRSFKFLTLLDVDNYGRLYLAEDNRLRKLFAVKTYEKKRVFENNEMKNLHTEKNAFRTVTREKHPFLQEFHCCFHTAAHVFFVTDYNPGGNLSWHVQRGRFDVQQVRLYAAELCLALKYLHEHDIVYRNLQLQSILLMMDGHIKLTDYNLCKENMRFESRTGTFGGSMDFIPPEMLLDKQYGRSVDWWCFGIVIFQMLLQQSPFRGEDADEVYDAILQDDPTYPEDLAEEWRSIISKLLLRDPEQRLGSTSADAQEIMTQPCFSDLVWDDVYHKRLKPTFIPQIANMSDTSNYNSGFTEAKFQIADEQIDLPESVQAEFQDFDYTADYA